MSISNKIDFCGRTNHYTYDIEGNVASMLLDVPHDTVVHQRYKRLDYYYDLVSGKVNELVYQHDSGDQFIHVYQYDADNRITDVLTSRDSLYWEHDAGYQYYDHGPLAREVIGQRQVQGVDYAYTINGWLKAVNSSITNPSYDMGHDGDVHGSNNTIGRDAYGFSLNYFNGDYRSIGTSNAVASGLPITSLYNGNISGATYSIDDLNPKTIGYTYSYDQLNRYVHSVAFKGIDTTSNAWVASDSISDFKEFVKYDENGNILLYIRHGNTIDGGHLGMDSLTYKYKKGANQLKQVEDAIASGNYPNDIDNEPDPNNYQYNGIGELAKDSAGGLDTIEWTVYGKVWKVIKTNGDSVTFTYDPMGNRLEKQYYAHHDTITDTTMYTRDATGNVMAIYNRRKDTVKTDEFDIYGSKRLGSLDTALHVFPAILHVPDTSHLDSATVAYLENQKQYELTNHLGNVLVTVSDRKWWIDTASLGYAQYYVPNIISSQDYYPFGMLQPGRTYKIAKDSAYRYAFNGKLYDNELYGQDNSYDYGKRFYDPRLGRFLSIDVMAAKYPFYTPYSYAGNKPIIAKDIDGEEEYVIIKDPNLQTGRINITMVFVPEKFRRTDPSGVGTYNGIDYYIGDYNWMTINNKTSTPTYSAANFADAEDQRIAQRSRPYVPNSGMNQGNGGAISNFSTHGSVSGPQTQGNLKLSQGNFDPNNHNELILNAGGSERASASGNFYFSTSVTDNFLPDGGQANLNVSAIIDNMKSDPHAVLVLTGFASKSGSVDKNTSLSKGRVEYIRSYIISKANQQHLDLSNRISIDYKGSSQAQGGSNANNADDRKVTGTVVP